MEACISKFESWSRLCRRCSVDGLFYRSEKVAAGSEARRCANCGYRGRPQAGVPKSRQAAPQSCNVVGLRHLLCEGCDQRTLGYGPGAVAKHPRLCGVCKCKRRPRYKKRGRKLSDLRVAMPGVTKGCLPSSGVLVGRRVVTARSRPGGVETIKLIPNSWSRSVQMATSWPTMLAADFVQEQVSKPEMTSLIYTTRKGTQVVRVGFKRPLTKVGTIRCCAATHLAPVVLTERTKYDLPACLKFARVHRLGVGRAWVHRTVVSPSFAEYLCGLPEGWTSVEPLRLSQSTLKMWHSPEETRRTVLDVFSGCLGLHLGLREYFRTVAYVEHDPPTREVIRARMKDGVVDRAPLLGDVKAVRALDLPELPDGLCAGFPCRDVSSAGCKQGFDGLESVLFREVARLIDEIISIDNGESSLGTFRKCRRHHAQCHGTRVAGDLVDFGRAQVPSYLGPHLGKQRGLLHDSLALVLACDSYRGPNHRFPSNYPARLGVHESNALEQILGCSSIAQEVDASKALLRF